MHPLLEGFLILHEIRGTLLLCKLGHNLVAWSFVSLTARLCNLSCSAMQPKGCSMKNVTVSLPEEVAVWSRVWAAEHDTSVSKMLGCFLKEKMDSEKQYAQAMNSFLQRKPVMLKEKDESYSSRDSLHER